MLMTDLAVRDLEGRHDSMVNAIRRMLVSLFGRTSDHHLPDAVTRRQPQSLHSTSAPGFQPSKPLRVVQPATAPALDTDSDQRWQRHPQLRSRQTKSATSGSGQRSARLEAERAMILARGGKLAEAIDAFTTAAADPDVDLSALPGFWDLPRNGMLTAVKAYERVNRLRDASALEARIRHLLKPRALKPISTGGRLTASGD